MDYDKPVDWCELNRQFELGQANGTARIAERKAAEAWEEAETARASAEYWKKEAYRMQKEAQELHRRLHATENERDAWARAANTFWSAGINKSQEEMKTVVREWLTVINRRRPYAPQTQAKKTASQTAPAQTRKSGVSR